MNFWFFLAELNAVAGELAARRRSRARPAAEGGRESNSLTQTRS